MDDDWATCDAEATVTALSPRYRFSRANAVQLLRDQGILLQRAEDDDDSEDGEDEEVDDEEDDWDACDAEAVVTALSARYRFSRANAVQLLRDQGILLQRDDDDDDDEEDSENDYDSDDPYFGCGLPCTNMQEPVIIPMPEQDLITVGAIAGEDAMGFQDGAAADAKFDHVRAILHLPGGRLLLADQHNDCIRLLSADLQEVSTVAGEADESGQGEYRDGAAAQARFSGPSGLALLSDGRVLVAGGNRIRMLSADLQQVSTLAGDAAGAPGYQDGVAAVFGRPSSLAVLHDGRVLVADGASVRVLSAAGPPDVSTLAIDGVDGEPQCFEILPDGRVLVATASKRIHVLEGFPPAPAPPKPAAKPPKKKQKRAA